MVKVLSWVDQYGNEAANSNKQLANKLESLTI
jgi:hypothetical protein